MKPDCSPTLTEEEKFLFDLKGYLLFPAVLGSDDVAEIKAHTERFLADRNSLPEGQRSLPGGPPAKLLDHPAAVRVLRSILDEDIENVRCEGVFVSDRKMGDSGKIPWRPHGNGRSVSPVLTYRYHNGRIYSGLTRVAWELNAVDKGKGGTAFIPGSHKANFGRVPARYDHPESGLWEHYECPPGSLLVFTEAVRHSAGIWQQEVPRLSLFFSYNHVCVRHDAPIYSDAMLDGLSPAHRRFFNDVSNPEFERQRIKTNSATFAELQYRMTRT